MRGLSKCVATAAIGAAALFVVSTSARANVLLNPGFESPDASGGDVPGTANWNSFNFTFTTASVPAHSGTQTLKVFGPFFQGGGSGVVQGGFGSAPGDIWQASAWLRNDSNDAMQGNNFAVVKMEFLNAANTVIGFAESPQFNAASDPQNTWTLRTIQGVAPAGTTSAQMVLVHVQLNDPVTGGSVFFDDAAFAIVPEPTSLALLGLAGMALVARRR
jgi:hypothetical protein